MEMIKKRLPIGLSDYKNLIEGNFYYVDKTLFINDLLTQGGHVCLFPRPRRFGKTLNISMLRYFFEKTDKSNEHLFEDKKIWQIPASRALHGKFPVILMTFKSVKESSWEKAYEKIVKIIADEYQRHNYLLSSDLFNEYELTYFRKIESLEGQETDYHMSLMYLSRFLDRYHKSKVIILIDEYDAPIHEAFLNGYYKEVTSFMRGFLGDGLKDNVHLELSVITGILRTAKEGIFSGLNNLKVFTILSEQASDKFGFTQDEIDQLLQDYSLEPIKNDFKEWYNGYLIGQTKIYNPWSSLNCVDEKGKFISYWANTSDNALVEKIIASGASEIKDACAQLVEKKSLPLVEIDDKMVLPGMTTDPNSIWALLLFTGYLTASSSKIDDGILYADLILPNKELLLLFKKLITDLFKKNLEQSEIVALEEALRNADGKLFSRLLSKFIVNSMSWHDIHEDEPEKSYHLFILGILVTLSHRYAVRSNRESGYGRYDIMIIPHDTMLPGFVIEFKKKDEDETIEESADRALEQIIERNYAAEIKSLGIKHIALWGIAFHKKQVLLKTAATE